MRRASAQNRNTMLFYYRASPLVYVTRDARAPSEESTDPDRAPFCQVYRRRSALTEYAYQESNPYCPMCTHDTLRAPLCGGASCATIQRERDLEHEWATMADVSDTDDGEYFSMDDWEDACAS